MSIARLTSASASERATALNENFLQRISADIHDGAGQDFSFALMRLKSLAEERPEQPKLAENLAPVRIAVEAALTDLRAISADLQLPDIAFELVSGMGKGTMIRAALPLASMAQDFG